MRRGALAGLRALVVEDEMIVSLMIEEILIDEQCVIVGPFARIAGALASAETDVIDFAVLDVNLAGVKVYPVADVLAARNIPFLFLSGYGKDAVPLSHPEWRVCGKPFEANGLIVMLHELLQQDSSSGLVRSGLVRFGLGLP